MQSIQMVGGIESALVRSRDGNVTDVLQLIGHYDNFEQDFDLIRNLGLQTIRYPIVWHVIEVEHDVYDWDVTDRMLNGLKERGINVIADPGHFTYPLWLDQGVLNPEFPELYHRYYRECVKRYPWITQWTPMNEALTLANYSCLFGRWYPFKASEPEFVRGLVNICKAMCLACETIRSECQNAIIVDVIPSEFHQTLNRKNPQWNPELQAIVDHCNERRFIVHDMIYGKVSETHPLWNWLFDRGFSDADACWFHNHIASVDVHGLDYYAHSSEQYRRFIDGHVESPGPQPIGLARMLWQWYKRYPAQHLMVTEVNIEGRIEDRLIWLRYCLSQCSLFMDYLKIFNPTTSFLGMCWFPLFCSHSWQEKELTEVDHVDTNGIYWAPGDDSTQRIPSLLSELFSQLCRKQLSYQAIPLTMFQYSWDELLRGYRTQMNYGGKGSVIWGASHNKGLPEAA